MSDLSDPEVEVRIGRRNTRNAVDMEPMDDVRKTRKTAAQKTPKSAKAVDQRTENPQSSKAAARRSAEKLMSVRREHLREKSKSAPKLDYHIDSANRSSSSSSSEQSADEAEEQIRKVTSKTSQKDKSNADKNIIRQRRSQVRNYSVDKLPTAESDTASTETDDDHQTLPSALSSQQQSKKPGTADFYKHPAARKASTIKLPPFDGTKMPLKTWLCKYENYCQFFQLTKSERVHHLTANLDGDAGLILWQLSDDPTEEEILELLQIRYGSANYLEKYRAELQTYRRQKEQSMFMLRLNG